MKNILILSNYLPKHGWGGGVIIRSLTKDYPSNLRIFWTIFRLNKPASEESLNNIEILSFKTKLFRGRGISRFILKLETLFFVNDYMKLIKKNNIDILWIVLGTSFLDIYRIRQLTKKISIPYHISVHDDPILEIKNKKKIAIQFFNQILLKANSIDVISSRMQAYYKNNYNVNSIVITRCISNDFPQNDFAPKDKIKILMGGYGNASQPWPNPLIESISQVNKFLKCELYLFDSKLKIYESDIIKVYDLMVEESFNDILKTINIGYACDDLKEENIIFAQLSLPTKVITYIGANIPFLYHGPINSTVGDLIKLYEVGIIVDSNNSTDLCNAFMKINSNYSYYQTKCRMARENLFSEKIVQENFYKLLIGNI